MENVTFQGTITREEFAEVYKNLLPWWAKPQIVALNVLFIMVTLGAGWGAVFNKPLSVLPDLLEALVIFVLYLAISAYSNSRNWKKITELQGEISGQLTEIGIDWNTQVSNTKLPWNKFLYYKEIKDLVLIFYSSRCAFYFPRRFFATDSTWSIFKQSVASKLKSK